MRVVAGNPIERCAGEPRRVAHGAGIAALTRRIPSLGWRFALLALIAPLGACTVDRTFIKAEIPDDYRARHPIKLTQGVEEVKIFAAGPTLDKASMDQIEALAKASRESREGGIEILFPRGGANDGQQRAALPAIRRALAAGGATGNASVGVYPVDDPATVAPIRVSRRSLRARVASTCGEWPVDLASGSSITTASNRPYWNHGCAYQSMIAAQVSDPRDLVEPRATGDGDVEMRIRAIGKVRQGSDPGTTWITKNSSIGTVGGN